MAHGKDIKIICGNAGSKQYLSDHREEVSKAIINYFSLPSNSNVVIIVDEEYNKPIKSDTFKENIQSQINMQVSFE